MKNDTIKLLLIFTPALFGSFPALANVSGGDWKPQIVEKMFVLPPQHLDKVLNNDFKTSVLSILSWITKLLLIEFKKLKFDMFIIDFLNSPFSTKIILLSPSNEASSSPPQP